MNEKFKKNRQTSLHFVGIGGIGMSGLSEVFLNQGYTVSGSDISESDTTQRLGQLGIKIYKGHFAQNVMGADVVVLSSAIRSDNPEIVAARKQRIPVIPRAEMLGELMRGKIGVAVAGSHGKTTTTAMLASIFITAGLDPTIVIGGKVNALGGNAKLGNSQYVIAEADESDGSFLHLPAKFAIITNIDNDHLDHFGNVSAIENAFIDFVGKLPFYGKAIVCAEDPGVQHCMSRWMKPFQTYGFSSDCDVFASQLELNSRDSQFQVFLKPRSHLSAHFSKILLGEVRLNVPGRHNILNALASISIGMIFDIPFNLIAQGLREFFGVKRRFEIRYEDKIKNRAIVHDYGHHPTEILATLATAKNFWPGRIISIFQPHRYTRTLHCYSGFLSAFFQSDYVMITDLYAAGEDPIVDMNASTLVKDMKKIARPDQTILYTGDLKTTHDSAMKIFSDGDLILCLGAGSIDQLADQMSLSQS